MGRATSLAVVILAVTAATTLAQLPVAPGAGGASAAPAGTGAGPQSAAQTTAATTAGPQAAVAKSTPSIWDYLGVGQALQFCAREGQSRCEAEDGAGDSTG